MHRFSLALLLIALPAATVVLDNPRVKVFRTDGGSLSGVDHGPGVVISLTAGSDRAAGSAVWMDDVAAARAAPRDRLVIVQPRSGAPSIPVPAPPPSRGSAAAPRPGEPPFTGMSFNTVFENDQVRVIRGRMEVGAREAFHTHGADTIVVHLSGGEIEDTANGKTVVNRWKPGDVEFEAVGSSHAARNLGRAVDAVLVILQP